MASIEEDILMCMRSILDEVREIRKNTSQNNNPHILNEGYVLSKNRLDEMKKSFSQFPGEDNGAD